MAMLSCRPSCEENTLLRVFAAVRRTFRVVCLLRGDKMIRCPRKLVTCRPRVLRVVTLLWCWLFILRRG